MENTIHIDEGSIYLFCYGKAIDLWIAEQGTECNEDRSLIRHIAQDLYEEYWIGVSKANTEE